MVITGKFVDRRTFLRGTSAALAPAATGRDDTGLGR